MHIKFGKQKKKEGKSGKKQQNEWMKRFFNGVKIF